MNKQLSKDKWVVANEEDGANIWGLSFFPIIFTYTSARYAKTSFWHCCMDFKGEHIRLIVPTNYWDKISRQIFSYVLKNPKYFTKVKNNTARGAKKLYAFADQVRKTEIVNLSNKKLEELFGEHFRLADNMIGWGAISTIVEIPHALFTTYAENFLSTRTKALGLTRLPGEYFHDLSAIETDGAQRREALGIFGILESLQKLGLHKDLAKGSFRKIKKQLQMNAQIWKQIQTHVKNFCWCDYNYNGPAFTEKRVVEELINLAKTGLKASVELRKFKMEKKNLPKHIDQAAQQLKLNPYEKTIFQALRDTSSMKINRRDALTYSFYALEKVLKEYCKRSGLSLAEARCILPGEHAKVQKNPKKFVKLLNERNKYCVLCCEGKKPVMLVGNKAKAYIKKTYTEEAVTETSEIKGQTACLGFAKGVVKIVNLPSEMSKMKKGDILVSVATMPEIVPAMKKAAAIVTNMGGLTSHAAIVSRELGVPCVIGTKIATKVLKDGDLVEVNANEGTVKKLK